MSRLSAGWRRRAGRGGSLALVALTLPAGASGAARWSDPAVLSRCPGASAPRVAFPAADPHTSSGPGAILWSGECLAGGGTGIGLAPIGAGDLAGPTRTLPGGPLAATAATGDGRIVIAGGLAARPAGAGSAGSGRAAAAPSVAAAGVIEGRAGSTFGPPSALRARNAPLATATSYLGDIAVATVTGGGRVQLRLQRHGAPGLSAPLNMSTLRQPVSAVAVGLDYRGDALVAWAQGGWISRRVLSSTGRLGPAERVAPSSPGPHLEALISDDDRGILAWTSEVRAGARLATRVYLDASGTGVHFGAPRLLEQFRHPAAP
ncbi:MAG: hypothetical protein QOF77_1609, partial [Solirubrobacteraceae bacterium]|nr:hypothetical protein [Solirubrobacteraceae bacterium]